MSPYLNARQAATYVGYEPTGGPTSQDRAMRAFYAWVRRARERHKIPTKRRGRRLLFLARDLDRAIDRCTDDHDAARLTRLEQMAELGRRHARGEVAERS